MQTAYKSIRLFKTPLFEKISHIHPLTPLLVWGPVVGWLLWRSVAVLNLGAAAILGVAVGALLTWSLSEYLLHRFVFHFHPHGVFQERLQFILHGIHHADPVDPTRLVMPPVVAVIMALIFYPLFQLVLGSAIVEPFFAFYILGYLAYDYIHYSVHHFKPRSRVGKFLKQSHMVHHYVDHNVRWGVSSPLWDLVFGTYSERIPAKPRMKKSRQIIARGHSTGTAASQVKLNRVGHGS